MAIIIPEQLELQNNTPLDNRLVKNTLYDRNNIPYVMRYEGMFVYVKETQKNYQLQNGITNSHWVNTNPELGEVFLKSDHVMVSQGPTSVARPIILNSDGVVDGSMIDLSTERLESLSNVNDTIPNKNDVLMWDNTGQQWIANPAITSFEALEDTPSNYSGQGNKLLRVRSTEDGVEYVAGTALYFSRSEFVDQSTGINEAGMPVKLDVNGKIHDSLINLSLFYYVGQFTPTSTTEYPDTTGESAGATWAVAGLTSPYTFSAGDLTGQTVDNGDYMVWGTSSWAIMHGSLDPVLFYMLDGSQPITAPFQAGGFQLKNLSNGSDLTDAVTVEQLNGKANVIHDHVISDIDGLQTELDGKAPMQHNHTLEELTDTNIPSTPQNQEVLTWSSADNAWIPATSPSGVTVHNLLTGRDAADAHPIESVTGLRDELDSKSDEGHTHQIDDVDGLQTELDSKAPANASIPIGGIIMYSGDIANIPTNWHLCDGTNGTPDLRGQFVIGGNGSDTGVTGGSRDAIIVEHHHTAVASSVFNGLPLPEHGHQAQFVGNPLQGHVHGGDVSIDIGSHDHSIPMSASENGTNAGSEGDRFFDKPLTDPAALRTSSYDYGTKTGSFTTDSVSAGTPTGAVTISNAGADIPQGNITTNITVESSGASGTGANLPPYYTLAYIMRIA